jgi:protein-S-isoprenylcysteine O-methyltransferase Ste14
MPSAFAALSTLWILWLLSWLLASGWSTKTVAQQTLASRIGQSVPIWIGAILLFSSGDRLWNVPVLPPGSWVEWGAVVLAVLGFALTWWARIHLGRFWSSAVTLKAEHSLIRSGPYAFTRHPIYTGLLLASFATALALGGVVRLAGVGLILIGLILKLREEERFLERAFGVAYKEYRRKVAALVPGVW